MTLLFHLSSMLCALATVVFAAAVARDPRRWLALSAGFPAGVFVSRFGVVDPVVVGGLALGAVAFLLFVPRYAMAGAVLGGAVCGVWSAFLQAQGLPFVVTPVVAVLLVVVTIGWVRARSAFAPAHLVDEGLLVIAALAVVVMTLPSILDGWQTAVTLAAASTREPVVPLPFWTATLMLICTSLGGLYALWSRR